MSTILIAMSFVLVFSAAALQASAAAAGGILQIPSNDSLAHCIPRCGDVDIFYPFGIGSGCFRQGFDLTCDHSTKPSKLFLGSSNIQVTDMYFDEVLTPINFKLATRPGTDTYNMSWEAPSEGITITSDNIFYIAGCDFDVTLFEYGTGDMVGSCMSRCAGNKAPTGGPCNGIGCCLIPLPRDLPGFRAKLVSTNTAATQLDWLHPGIMAFVSVDESYVGDNTTYIFSSWTSIDDAPSATLSITIMDQPSCESAQMNNTSYACSNGSSCQNSSSGGYQCYCSSYGQGNPYILDGCIQDYNPKTKDHCPASCGRITVPFPFGLEEGCFANEKFHLNCTSGNVTVSFSEEVQYYVTDVSVEDGTLAVGNMVNGSNKRKEEIITQVDNGYIVDALMEDQLDFSVEYNIVIKLGGCQFNLSNSYAKGYYYVCMPQFPQLLPKRHPRGNIYGISLQVFFRLSRKSVRRGWLHRYR